MAQEEEVRNVDLNDNSPIGAIGGVDYKDRKDGLPNEDVSRLVQNNRLSEHEMEEEIERSFNHFVSCQTRKYRLNMTVDRGEKIRSIIKSILENFTYVVRKASKSQPIYQHYVTVAHFNEVIMEKNEVTSLNSSYNEVLLGKIVNSVFREPKLKRHLKLSGKQFYVYLFLVERT